MARIEGPSPRRLIESISEKQVEAPSIEAPVLPPPAPGLMGPLTPPPLEDSGFSVAKKKPVRMSGAFRGAPAQPREPIAAFQVRPGVTAETGKGTLQVKGGDAKAETAKKKEPTPLDLMSKVAGMNDKQRAALQKDILAGKADPKMMAAHLELLAPIERGPLMQQLKPKQVEQLKTLMRAGDLPNNTAVGLGVRLASETDWAKKNPEVAKTMIKAYADGAIRMADKDTQIAGLGMTSASGIDLKDQLRRSPEALAATVAHEAVHQHDGSGAGCCSGNFDATPAGELKGMEATTSVWAQLNPKGTDPNLGDKQVKLLNDLAAAQKAGPGKFKETVLGFYTNFYQEKLKELDAGKISKSQGPYLEKTEKAFREAYKAATK